MTPTSPAASARPTRRLLRADWLAGLTTRHRPCCGRTDGRRRGADRHSRRI